ncbi:MAG: ZIP family metal transporter [Sutterellaceae bacterium]|nr:ZIP family metal transporter [Burkholderiaceae bacterium]MCX7902023.1 ZIP family metal transporter [Burkholderiaceae bacterium]MDW8430911.1 ZIP family metal transporter [Sutterellaceae bacterium]
MNVLRDRNLATSAAIAATLAMLGAGIYSLGPAYQAAAMADAAAVRALWLGTVSAFATAIGALAAVSLRERAARHADVLLGFGAGVMLAAAVFSLVVPGLEAARALGASAPLAALLVGLGIGLGAAAVHTLDRLLPHEHFIKGVEGVPAGPRVRRVWLFVGAIAIHNIPEGMAIGVGAAGLQWHEAAGLAAGIAVQNVPEGLVPVVALVSIGYRLHAAALVGIASGLIEPVTALAAAASLDLSGPLLPLALGIAGGAMIYVVSHEIIPESHRHDRGAQATAALIAGFVAMMLLDNSFGS